MILRLAVTDVKLIYEDVNSRRWKRGLESFSLCFIFSDSYFLSLSLARTFVSHIFSLSSVFLIRCFFRVSLIPCPSHTRSTPCSTPKVGTHYANCTPKMKYGIIFLMCECDLNRISSFHLAFVLNFDLISITSDMQINRKLKIIANFQLKEKYRLNHRNSLVQIFVILKCACGLKPNGIYKM